MTSLNDSTQWPSPLSGSIKGSYAYKTISQRMPVILTKVVDYLSRHKTEIHEGKFLADSAFVQNATNMSSGSSSTVQDNWSTQEAQEELKCVLGAFSKLRNEMQTNKSLTLFPLPPTGSSAASSPDFDDLAEWNNALQSPSAVNLVNSSDTPRWFDSSWLFVECYMYRRIAFALQQTKHLARLDPFKWQKAEQLQDSVESVNKMLDYLNNTLEKVALNETQFSDVEKREFENLLRLSLWGNKGDLSHNAGRTKPAADTTADHSPHELQKQMKAVLIVDDSDLIWEHLKSMANISSRRIDFICDNYGFELITDLILGEFLIASQIATQVVYHVKSISWFVSDTTVTDFYRILDIVNDHSGGFGDKWKNYIKEGIFVIKTDWFWTLPYSYNLMESISPKLYTELQKSALLIFKGDLNYRKLTADLQWKTWESFTKALRGFHPAPLCALRGLKADVVVGLRAGQEDELRNLANDWMISGHFAVIQFVK